MVRGDGIHKLPVAAALRTLIGKQADETGDVYVLERLGAGGETG